MSTISLLLAIVLLIQFLSVCSIKHSERNTHGVRAKAVVTPAPTTTLAPVPSYVPIPPSALPVCKNCSTKGYDIVQLSDDVFAISDGQYWAMAVLNRNLGYKYDRYSGTPKRTLAVVDAPPTITKYVQAIQDILSWTGATTVTDFILTHHHKDHIDGGADVVKQWPKARVIAHQQVKQVLTDGRDIGNRPIPTVTFATSYTLDTYGLELTYPFQQHTSGNIIVYHPKSKVLLLIDVIFPRWVPFKQFAVSESVPGFVKAYDTVLSYDFKTIIAGHLTRLGDRQDVLQGQRYVNDVITGAKNGLATVDANAIGAQVGAYDPTSPNYGNYWAVFDAYLNACAAVCTQQVTAKWLNVIGGVDVWTSTHCEAAVESVRID